jgi:hypothetical protein
MTWSRSEKAVARQAFDAALKRELHELMQEAKEIADRIKRAVGPVGPAGIPNATT